MRLHIKILLLLLFPLLAISQDTTITISPGMATQYSIALGNMDGWLFKQGNDTAWANKDINIAGWEKMKPAALPEKHTDKKGRLEGWFRIRIKLDSAFRDTALGLHMNAWAASDVYVDGNLGNSFGNTGINGQPFEEFNPIHQFPVSFDIDKGNEHVIAVHIVDFLSPLPPHHLKSGDRLRYFISITTPGFKTGVLSRLNHEQFYRTMLVSVNAILCLLFWLLAFQNRAEKNLLLIGATTTALTLVAFCETYYSPGISYFDLTRFAFVASIFRIVALILIIVLLLRIFKRKVTLLFKIALPMLFIGGLVQLFYDNYLTLIFQALVTLFLYSYCIITSWKTLKGAQWAVVAGVLLTLSFGLLLATSSLVNPDLSYSLSLLYYSGLFLSFPLSLLVYVSMRFREIITEVQRNAKQVVQLSEEKKEQALNQQKILQEEVNRQTAEIRTTLDNLKSAQTQLIQSEKMASLGELTAGIAHEIQNPLNFVNNFSEVSNELIDEMNEDLNKGNIDEAKLIASDLKQNLEKINQHGKRADAIVKGMLQHSQSSTGVKEPTDINVLADEYLRLSYHGMRAKDHSFNATMKTDFDETIGNINIIPQDIGRVLLNLYNNAFYAAPLPSRQGGTGSEAGFKDPHYKHEPTVWVSTKKIGDKVFISVKDNGPGIAKKIIDKIFQPFFTTKPTGQGTGLGLSLAYDIVKANGGEIKVNTKENEGLSAEALAQAGTEFIVSLPS